MLPGSTRPRARRRPSPSPSPATAAPRTPRSSTGAPTLRAKQRRAPPGQEDRRDLPHARPEQPEGVGAVPRHDDVRRPDRSGRGGAHRRRCARARRELPRHGRRLRRRRLGGDGRPAGAAAPRRLGGRDEGRQRDERPREHGRLLARLDDARARGQPAAPRDGSRRDLLPAPRLRRHPPRGAAARARRHDQERQGAGLGHLELPRLADRGARAPRGRARAPASRRLPAVLQPPQPDAGGRDPAGVRPLRHRRRAVQPGRARRPDRQVPAGGDARRGHAGGPRRPSDDADGVPAGVPRDRAGAARPRRGEGSHAAPARDRLGAREPHRHVGDRRPAHPRAVDGLPAGARRRARAGRRGRRRPVRAAGPPPRRRATPTRRTPCSAARSDEASSSPRGAATG